MGSRASVSGRRSRAPRPRAALLLAGIAIASCGGGRAHVPAGERAPPPPNASAAKAPPRAFSLTPAASFDAPPPAMDGAFDFVFARPAWDAVLVAGRVITLDPDFTTLSAYSIEDGKSLWKIEVQERASGRQALILRDGAILFWAGNRLHRIDPATGVRSSEEVVPWNNECSFTEERAVCAFDCKCSLELADCATGKLRGKRYVKSSIEFHFEDDSSSTCLWGTDFITSTDKIAVVKVEDEKSKPARGSSREHVVLGLSTATGQEVWRSPGLALSGIASVSGASPDGQTCFQGDYDGDLRVFDCATGAALWAKAGVKKDGKALRSSVSYVAERAGIFRSLGGEATLHSARTGAPLWRAPLAPGFTAIPKGAPIGLHRIHAEVGEPLTMLVLKPGDGSVVARVPVPEGATVHDDPAGGFYVHAPGGDLTAYDKDGRERGRVPQASPPNAMFQEHFVELFDDERIVILDRDTLRPLGELGGHFSVRPGSSPEGGVLLYQYTERGTKVGTAIMLRLSGR